VLDYGLVGYIPVMYKDFFLCHNIQTSFLTDPTPNSLGSGSYFPKSGAAGL
jgi:hypothetical protein